MYANLQAMTSPVLHPVDMAILAAYFISIVLIGIVLSRRARRDIDSYFLGGKTIPWYLLGISNASGQFDITGTMWLVMLMFVYGVKSVWIPWVWPTFNQIFLMVFLATWLRRSNVLTGAEWLRTRFGAGKGLELAHISVVLFALVAVVSFLAYAFIGIGKFAVVFLPWNLHANTYALLIMSITALYVILGGMFSVVLTDILQFILLSVASILVAAIAIAETTPVGIRSATPEGWDHLWFTWHLNIDWSNQVELASREVATGGYDLFVVFIMMALLKGILASLAGPAPNYDMQRVLAARNPREASLMSGIVSPVLYVPRYFLISGIAVLGLVSFSNSINTVGNQADFEQLLPLVMHQLPVGVKGILLAGLFAAFMSTFDSTVNSGAAYLVNDIYKRYLRPAESSRTYVRASYLCSVAVVVIGIAMGHLVGSPSNDLAGTVSSPGWSIDDMLQWITAGLYGGYVAPNVLKWVWWRLNGAGYFTGMISGVALALVSVKAKVILSFTAESNPAWQDVIESWMPLATPLNLFPLILILSGLATVIASLATKPDDKEILTAFYQQVRPWGFWGPIQQQVQQRNPSYEPNHHFRRDMVNCVVGIAWQITLCLIPIYTVLRQFDRMLYALLAATMTTVILKFNWYDKLPRQETGVSDTTD